MINKINFDEYPLVSVITLTYNSNQEYLFEAIDSVLIQTYPNIEYIISDDGSDNFQENKIREYLNKNCRKNIQWKIIQNKVNVGTVKNMNNAIKSSNGEYIFVLAHDDVYYNKDVIMDRYIHFVETGALITFALTEYVSFDLKKTIRIFPNKKQINIINNSQPKKLLNEIWFADTCLHGAVVGYSKSFFIKVGYFDEKCRLVEDYSTFCKALHMGINTYILEKIAIKYRSSSSDKENRYYSNPVYIQDMIEITKNKLHYFQGIKEILLIIELYRLLIKLFLITHNQKYSNIYIFIERVVRDKLYR